MRNETAEVVVRGNESNITIQYTTTHRVSLDWLEDSRNPRESKVPDFPIGFTRVRDRNLPSPESDQRITVLTYLERGVLTATHSLVGRTVVPSNYNLKSCFRVFIETEQCFRFLSFFVCFSAPLLSTGRDHLPRKILYIFQPAPLTLCATMIYR